jgi:hypothetical protein
MTILRVELAPGDAGSNPPASGAPEPRLSGAAMRIDKPELRVESLCFFCPEQWRLQYGLGLERGRRGDQGPIMAIMYILIFSCIM